MRNIILPPPQTEIFIKKNEFCEFLLFFEVNAIFINPFATIRNLFLRKGIIMQDLQNILGLGVAGNFANHLEQAGEAEDFAIIQSDDENAPKGIFPYFVPNDSGFLGRFCFDNNAVILPQNKDLQVQAEAEVGLMCEIIYDENNAVKNLIPTHFMAFNDASVRNDKNATKLSQKKNFSFGSKGFGSVRIAIPKGTFTQGGICDDYSIISFIKTNGILEQYGELSRLDSYSYFYTQLMQWLIKGLNHQSDFGVLESLPNILRNANYPKRTLIAIGATRYTNEKRFLRENDTISIIVFNHKKYSFDYLWNLANNDFNQNNDDISILVQKVVR